MTKPTTPYTDAEILEGLKGGGRVRREMEEVLYRRFASLIWQRPRKYRLSEEEATQAYNDAIIGLLKQVDAGNFRGESSLYTYLRRIFLRRCIDIFRSGPTIPVYMDSLEERMDLPDESVNIIRRLISQDELRKALALLQQLGERCRELLMMSAEGYRIEEITQRLGLKNADSTYSTRHQCKKKLLDLLSAEMIS